MLAREMPFKKRVLLNSTELPQPLSPQPPPRAQACPSAGPGAWALLDLSSILSLRNQLSSVDLALPCQSLHPDDLKSFKCHTKRWNFSFEGARCVWTERVS